MPGARSRRVGEQIQRYLSSKLIPALRDPRLGFATVTAVDVSPDLKTARVYLTIYDQDEGRRKQAFRALAGAAGHFRHMIAKDLRLRHTPALSFHEDESIDRADRIEHLIRDIRSAEPSDAEGLDDTFEGSVDGRGENRLRDRDNGNGFGDEDDEEEDDEGDDPDDDADDEDEGDDSDEDADDDADDDDDADVGDDESE